MLSYSKNIKGKNEGFLPRLVKHIIYHRAIFLAIFMLMFIGLLCLYSSSQRDALKLNNFLILPTRFLKQLIFNVVLIVFFMLLSQGKFLSVFIYRHAYKIYFINLIMLVAVKLLGYMGMGAKRWLNLYFFNLQPSELSKISLIIFTAKLLPYCKLHFFTFSKYFCFLLIGLFIPLRLIIKQPDLGTALVIIILIFSMIFVAGLKKRSILAVVIGIGLTMPLIWLNLYEYQRQRIIIFLDPLQDPLKNGYNILQATIAIGSGGVWGKGWLKGSQSQLNFLPEKQTDFIFSALLEEWGILGALLIWFCYIIIIYRVFSFIPAQNKLFYKLIIFGIGFILFLSALINCAMNVGLLPVVGIPLPFISYGGSSSFTLILLLSIAISCSKL